MAGRGRRGIESSKQNEEAVLRYSASGEWEEVDTVSHADIDLRKTARCGVGPADSFAQCLRSSGVLPKGDRIGFVPCAIGGTSLNDWAPDAESPEDDQNYCPTSRNFFHAAVDRAGAAISACNTDSASSDKADLKAVLWYQGETDAMNFGTTDKDAATYATRFEIFAEALTQALSPLSSMKYLPILTVAITACSGIRKSFPWLTVVRTAQLGFGRGGMTCAPSSTSEEASSNSDDNINSSLSVKSSAAEIKFARISVVDAFGLRLDPTDGIHLTVASQSSIGNKLCEKFIEMLQNSDNEMISLLPSLASSTSTCNMNPKDSAPMLEISKSNSSFPELQWAIPKAKSIQDTLEHTYSLITSLEYGELCELATRQDSQSIPANSFPDAIADAETSSGTFPLFKQRKRKMVNFVYGEISIASIAALLNFISPKAGEVLVDLGAGAGKVVLTAALLYPELGICRGVELMEGYVRDAKAATTLLTARASLCNRIEWRTNDFLESVDTSWGDANILFACSTCFDQSTMETIALGIEKLKTGARIVTLDKPIISSFCELISVSQVHGSWGHAVAYLYHRTSAVPHR